ncbi:MAG: 4Fe-4S binding protein [Lachnospiraceae bacterium]|nr:4Fe-4S binding protein [Lachnospiraceae bacterium]
MGTKIKRAVSLYFSPLDTTRRVVHSVAQGLDAPESLELDRTSFDSRWQGVELGEGDVAVIGMPVYYGRVPKILVEFFRYIQAKDIPAVVVVAYGNRDYEDALLELYNESRKHGFNPVAAGAFVGQHSFTDKLGTGRPNAEDLADAYMLGQKALEILEKADSPAGFELKVKGNFPYTPGSDLPIAPVTDKEKCVGCMQCQKNCPVLAINPLDPGDVDGWRCLDCGKCIAECKAGAKSLAQPALREKIAIMEAMFTAPKQSELFY